MNEPLITGIEHEIDLVDAQIDALYEYRSKLVDELTAAWNEHLGGQA